MAKFGEGDERWLVKDLGQDGRNVNNWHWVERDALPWSKTRLKELLVGQVLTPEGHTPPATITKVAKLDGEAIVNNRKSKIIVAYELDLVLGWEGKTADGTTIKGELKLPYISEENHDEDPEVLVALKEESKAGQALRELIVKYGRPVVHKAVAQFVAELRAGGPVAKGSSAAEAGGATQEAGVSAAPAAEGRPAPAAPAVAAAPSSSGRAPRDRRRIDLTERFYASAKDIYECFTDARRVSAYTQSAAVLEARVGGELSMFGGSVQGVFRELQAPHRIVMDWRFSNWCEGDTSSVTIDIQEPEKGSTTLHLVQTDIPDTDRFGQHDVLGLTQAGWANQIFHRIRQVFGYGI